MTTDRPANSRQWGMRTTGWVNSNLGSRLAS